MEKLSFAIVLDKDENDKMEHTHLNSCPPSSGEDGIAMSLLSRIRKESVWMVLQKRSIKII
jgi:hypothetical protein